MAKLNAGDVLSETPRILVVEGTNNFVTIRSPAPNAYIHEFMWMKGYKHISTGTLYIDGQCNSTFQKHF
jgi:hypothetical protein